MVVVLVLAGGAIRHAWRQVRLLSVRGRGAVVQRWRHGVERHGAMAWLEPLLPPCLHRLLLLLRRQEEALPLAELLVLTRPTQPTTCPQRCVHVPQQRGRGTGRAQRAAGHRVVSVVASLEERPPLAAVDNVNGLCVAVHRRWRAGVTMA